MNHPSDFARLPEPLALPAVLPWKEGSIVGVPPWPKAVTCVFINTYVQVGVQQWPAYQWNTVDLTGSIPADAKAVFLSSLLIITHGQAPEIADLTLAVRQHGITHDNSKNYHGQTIATDGSGGSRQPDFIVVALSPDLKFDFYWQRGHSPEWPQGSSYCINMGVAAYLR